MSAEPSALDGHRRCWWPGEAADYIAYHDHEWGRPVDDDRRLFEKICLEGFQSGLSWITILRKRAAFRAAFAGFDWKAIADFTEADIDRLVADPGIVRHRGKIVSVINNARRMIALRAEFGSLGALVWRFEPGPDARPLTRDRMSLRAITRSPQSEALSDALRRRGWSFVGPTTLYAFMQSVGIVNDHEDGCHVQAACDDARARFVRPM